MIAAALVIAIAATVTAAAFGLWVGFFRLVSAAEGGDWMDAWFGGLSVLAGIALLCVAIEMATRI